MRRGNVVAIGVGAIMLAAVSLTASGPPFELSVKRDRFVGSSRGTLVFGAEAVEYRTTNDKDARRWAYEDLKQVQVLSPTRVALLTYEDRGRLRLGADRTFDFTLVRETVSSDLVTFLINRIPQPVVTAVMPAFGGEPLARLRVKHQRQGRGSEGTLVLYDRQLVYETSRTDDSRYWRFSDIFSVLRLDRMRLQITVYEGGAGATRVFVFALKSDLPDCVYDTLWARVNPFPRRVGPQTGDHMAESDRPSGNSR